MFAGWLDEHILALEQEIAMDARKVAVNTPQPGCWNCARQDYGCRALYAPVCWNWEKKVYSMHQPTGGAFIPAQCDLPVGSACPNSHLVCSKCSHYRVGNSMGVPSLPAILGDPPEDDTITKPAGNRCPKCGGKLKSVDGGLPWSQIKPYCPRCEP